MKLEERLMKTILEQVAKRATEEQLNEEQITELIQTAIKAMTTDGLENASGFLAKKLRQQIPEMIAHEHAMQEGFEQRLYDRWKKALDLYDAIVILTIESGEHYRKQHTEQSAREKDNVFGVLVHIHAKACQTASAIGVLLKSGYARDALARQRTLHELAVTAYFIKKHGQDTTTRFWLHNTIESYKAALQYEQYCKRLGYEPHDPAYLSKLRSQRDALISRFGSVYGEQYGWAAHALGKTRGVSFSDIEEDIGLDHLRPYYRMASHGVHANPKGLIFDIGNIDRDIPGYHRPMLAGASNAGLADPGQAALISLNQCTVALLTWKNDLETLMKVKVLDSFVHEACQAFIEIHQELILEEEERIKAIQAQDNSG
jgi:hypothetical protein